MGARVADLLVAQGIEELIVVVSPTDDEIRPYFEAEAALGVPLRFVEQHERKGSGHALQLVAPHLQGEFIVSACDNLVATEHVAAMVATHRARMAAATLSLMPIDVAQASKTGVVVWDEPLVRRVVEKPKPEEAPSNISSLPLYLFSPAMLAILPDLQPSARGELELPEGVQLLIERGGLVTGVLTAMRQQVTNAADLLALNLYYLACEPTQLVIDSPLPASVKLIPPVHIESDVVIGAGCELGPRVYVERGAHIGDGAQVTDALILRGAEVAAGARIEGAVVGPA
jgi:NDP-sugar pyrophosphorylase family protein